MTRRENSLFEQKIITSPDYANAQTFPSLSSCPAGTQLSCTGSNKVISFRSTVSRVILLCITQSQGLHPEHVSMRRRRWCCPFLLRSATDTAVVAVSATKRCQGRCRHHLLVQHQLPPLSARDCTEREVMSLSSPGERAPPLVTPTSQEAAPSSCALARPAPGTCWQKRGQERRKRER